MPIVQQPKPKRNYTWLIVGIVVLLCAVLAGVYRWRIMADASDYAAADKQAKVLVAQENYLGALSELDSYDQGWPPRTHHYETALARGAIKEMQHDYPAALVAYRKAEALDKVHNLAEIEAIARTSERSGDKATALAYYRKWLAQMPTNKVALADETSWLKRKIESLSK